MGGLGAGGPDSTPSLISDGAVNEAYPSGRGGIASPRRSVDTRGVNIRIEPGVEAPGEARHALEADKLPEELLDDAKLLVSELVTNCIRHARLHPGQWIGVRARPTPHGMRLEVCDPGPGFPAPPPIPRSLHPFGGRGLPIVARVASRWGARRTRAGRWEVWLELDR